MWNRLVDILLPKQGGEEGAPGDGEWGQFEFCLLIVTIKKIQTNPRAGGRENWRGVAKRRK